MGPTFLWTDSRFRQKHAARLAQSLSFRDGEQPGGLFTAGGWSMRCWTIGTATHDRAAIESHTGLSRTIWCCRDLRHQRRQGRCRPRSCSRSSACRRLVGPRSVHGRASARGDRRVASGDGGGATRALQAAAARLGVALSDHAVVMQRVQAAVGRLDGKLARAKDNGDLKFFNRAYHAYRLVCQHRGEHAMPYGTAVARLRKLLAGAAAGASVPDVPRAVFER
jgi:hypothetical protein